jgi:hypothetical protein
VSTLTSIRDGASGSVYEPLSVESWFLD